MKDLPNGMNNAQLDSALETLTAPPPSDILRTRVCAMAPQPERRFLSARYQAAAALVIAIATAAVVHVTVTGPAAVPVPVAAASEPADEIMAPDLALVDGPTAPESPETPFSVAGLPLE
jgi:hypothetical protein